MVVEGAGRSVGEEILLFKLPARVVEGAKLDGDASADAEEGAKGAFVEGEGAFVREDLPAAVEGGGVLRGGLQTDFDDIWSGG